MNQNFLDICFHPGFGSDNHSGIHPQILKAILECNKGHAHSYGMDEITSLTKEYFYFHFGSAIDIYYVFNGTAANVLCLSALLQSYQSVLCAESSHLFQDECGAPEKFLGCQIIPVKSKAGKLDPDLLAPYLIRRGDQHRSAPKAISITQPTELGTTYSLLELAQLVKFCRQNDLLLHMDGARLANAACFLQCSFGDLVEGVDALSFGGTKNGLWGAEAVILFRLSRNKNFKFIRKQSMQLPSKTRFLSAQFFAYFQHDLWKSIAHHSLNMAQYFKKSIADIPAIDLAYPVQSNALFPVIPRSWVKPLKKHSFFYVWEEQKNIMRWMTTFDTNKEQIDSFVHKIKSLTEAIQIGK